MSRARETVQIAVRIPTAMVQEADTLARDLSTQDVPLTRSDALRMALRLGMLKIAEELGATEIAAKHSDDPPHP